MSYYNNPQMSRRELLGRLKAFVEIEPEGSDTAHAAVEIIELLTRGTPNMAETIDAKTWQHLWNYKLSTDAAILGSEILYGDISADPNWLKLDMNGVPPIYQKALRPFMEQFIQIMAAGPSKGYTIWDTLEDIDWQKKEGIKKFGEFIEELTDGNTDRAGRAVTKCATAAFCLYAAFVYYSGLPKWFQDGKLDDRAADLLDEYGPEDH